MLVACIGRNNLEYLICRIGNLKYTIPISIRDAFNKIHTTCGRYKTNLQACCRSIRITPLQSEEISIACERTIRG